MHLKLKKKYLGKCTGAPTTFKDLKSRQPTLPAATAQISPPASNAYDSDDEFLTNGFSGMSSDEPQFGFRQIYVTGFSTDRVVDETTIPIYEEMLKTRYVKDKVCVICQKSGMNLDKLDDHVTRYHDMCIDDPIEQWMYSAELWDDQGMTYSDSEPENNEIADDSDQEFEAEYLPHLSPTPIR